MESERFIRQVLRDVMSGRLTEDQAAERLLQEMGRGGVILKVDENCLALAPLLMARNYTTETVEPGLDDQGIKRQIRSRVFITRNGQHFNDPKDLERFDYGLVWVRSRADDRTLARSIERTLMRSRFNSNQHQVVEV